MMSRRTCLQLLPALAMLPLPARAQSYPTRPVRVIVPLSPGSGTDVVARYMSTELARATGGSFVVENRVGASGVIGTDFVAKAPADGYTLLFNYAAHYSNPFVDKTPYDAVADFVPIARLATSAMVLVTAASSPLRTARDLIAAAKRKPGGLTYGSPGNGTTPHMAAALMSNMAGIQMTHVPYKAPAQVVVDVAGGQLDAGFGGVATSLPLVKAGRLRVLAVTSARRSAYFPDTPTLDEVGLKGYELVTPIWAFARHGTPQAIVSQLSTAMTKAGEVPAFKEFCATQGLEPDIQPEAGARASAPAELERWKKLVALSQLKPG